MSITLEEVKKYGLLDEDIIDLLPDEGHCKCGAEFEFTESLNMYCPNRYCYMKIAARLESMASALKADGWGQSTCETVCRTFKFKTPLNVFKLEPIDCECPGVSAFRNKVNSICNSKLRKMELWQVVKILNLPNIGDTALKLFNGYNTIDEAYKDFEELQVPFIAERLGITSGSDSSILANNVYNTLMDYKNELLLAETYFTITKPTGETLKIVITKGVNGYKNKSEFISYLNIRFEGKINAILLNSISSETDVLIADSDEQTSKHKKAVKLGVDILTSEQLIALLEESSKGQ